MTTPPLRPPAAPPADPYFQRILETLPAGAYVCDGDGLITYFNPHAARLWGREPKLNDPIDRYCGSFKLFLPDGSPIRHDQCWMARALQDREPFIGCEILVERPDGERRMVLAHASPVHDEAGRVVGAVNVLVDVSDRKRAEEDLRRTAAERDAQLADLSRLHDAAVRLSGTQDLQPVLEGVLRTAAAIERTDRGLLSLCEPDGSQLTVGASLGFDEEFLAAINPFPSGMGACATCLKRRERLVVEDVETDPVFAPHRAAARRAGFRAVHSTPLITRDGRIVGVLTTHFARTRRPTRRETHLIDLLARQAVEAIENARLCARLRDQDRRKDEFLAVLAHELRNPLAPIQNAVQILRARGPAEPILEGARNVIDRQARQLARLVEDLLDLSRITTGKLELRRTRIDLEDVLQAAVETSRPLIEAAGLTLTLDLPAEPVPLDGDQARLAQVLSNLLNNAARYTERGGTVTLAAERQGSDAVVRVKDTGIGIAPDMLLKVFDMFAQADRDRSTGGLGIGLTLVRKLTEMHGGTVEARSDGPGRGSEFVVRLPVVLEGAGGRRACEGVRAGPSLRVLVVDDNRDAVSTLGMLLRLLGHEVREAYDGAEAVERAADFRPDVVLLDIGLPKLSGYEAAAAIRAEPWGRSAALWATTGWGQAADRERSQAAGFDAHLVKPVDPAELIGRLAAEARARAASFAH